MFWLEAARELASGLEASNSEFKAAVSHVQLSKNLWGTNLYLHLVPSAPANNSWECVAFCKGGGCVCVYTTIQQQTDVGFIVRGPLLLDKLHESQNQVYIIIFAPKTVKGPIL